MHEFDETLPIVAIAPNAFRGSLTAIEATKLIAEGLAHSDFYCTILEMPLADGGDGTLDVWLNATGGQRHAVTVSDPLSRAITAEFGLAGNTAVIEMARASGIELLQQDERNPLQATTYGTGELILGAIASGATEILIGVGGSATVDGGAGCLQALGAHLLDKDGQAIGFGGGELARLASIDVNPVLKQLDGVKLSVLCDVDNPLVGDRGAARVFGPQKGASSDDVEILEANLAHFAAIVARDVGRTIADVAHGGAAGGLSAGLYAVGASLDSGIERMIAACGYKNLLTEEEPPMLLITGEGKLDAQSHGGKAPIGIAKLAYTYEIPVIALVGALEASPQQLQEWYIDAAYSIVQRPCSLEEAIANAPNWLRDAANHVGNLLALWRY